MTKEKNKVNVVVGSLIKVCAGKRHAWFYSNVGKIRKPYNAEYHNQKG